MFIFIYLFFSLLSFNFKGSVIKISRKYLDFFRYDFIFNFVDVYVLWRIISKCFVFLDHIINIILNNFNFKSFYLHFYCTFKSIKNHISSFTKGIYTFICFSFLIFLCFVVWFWFFLKNLKFHSTTQFILDLHHSVITPIWTSCQLDCRFYIHKIRVVHQFFYHLFVNRITYNGLLCYLFNFFYLNYWFFINWSNRNKYLLNFCWLIDSKPCKVSPHFLIALQMIFLNFFLIFFYQK